MWNVEQQTLRLLQSGQILHVLTWLAFHKFVHLELIHHTGFLTIISGWNHETPVCVQEASEASHKRRTNLIWSKRCGTDDTDRINASAVSECGATCDMLDGS